MTVQAQNSVQYYNGPIEIGTELSIVEFTFIDNSHVSAKVRGNTEVWQYGYDYTISGAQTLVRTITVQRRVAENEVLAVYLDVPITQNISPEEGGNFPASTNEYVLDKLTHISQMLDERLKRSLQISIDTPFSGTLPAPEPNKALKISPDGNSFVMSDYDPDTALVLTEQYRTEAQAAAEVAVASKDTSIEKANIATEKAAVATTQANRVEDIYTEAVPVLNQIISNGQSGLSNTIIEGQQSLANASNALRQTQITNCLLEVPQNIKLELADGVLTLKAGSKVIVPNGAGVFEEVTITQDISYPSLSHATADRVVFVNTSNNLLIGWDNDWVFSGSAAPSPNGTTYAWYDTTNNIVKYTGNSGSTWTTGLSLPICIGNYIKDSGFTSIDQVFNGFGYIGSRMWVDKGVKAIIPNGRNDDGTLNNIELTTRRVSIQARQGNTGSNGVIFLDKNGNLYITADNNPYYEQETQPNIATANWARWFNTKENLQYTKSANKDFIVASAQYAVVGKITSVNDVLSDLQIKQPFRAVDYNDYSRDMQQLLLEKTPNRFLTFNAKRKLTLAANTHIQLDTRYDTRYLNNTVNQTLNIESMLDSGATLQAGKAYSIFLVPSATGGVELKVSLNSTAPTGYNPLDTRRIGGFSTLCRDAGTISWHANHPLSGFVAGDIIPQSVWTLYHRPYASPNNCIYIPAGIPFWRTIYDHSGTLSTTSFEYGGTVTRTRTFYGHMQDMMHAGYILPTYEQAAISGYGCEPLKAVSGKAETSITTAGGHVNESNNRIISIYGAEDCVGCTWKLTTIGAIGGSNWSTDASVGVHQYGSVNVLRVGGGWGNSGLAGPFATSGYDSALFAISDCASFGVSYPLPRKSEGTS